MVERGDRHALVEMRDIHFFLDSHHVGSFEAVLQFAGAGDGAVWLRRHSPGDADLYLAW